MSKLNKHDRIYLVPYIKRLKNIANQIAEKQDKDHIVHGVEVKYFHYSSGENTSLYLYIEQVGSITNEDPEKAFQQMITLIKKELDLEVTDKARKAKYAITN